MYTRSVAAVTEAPPSAVTAPLLDALQAASDVIANAYEGDWNAASLDWRDAAQRWRDAYRALLAIHVQGSAVEPLADEMITAALLKAVPVSRALAEALAEIIGTVASANAEARTAWAKVNGYAAATARLHEELEAFPCITGDRVVVDRQKLKALLTGFEVLCRRGLVTDAADDAANDLWQALGGRDD
jgi:hypothetical protein